MKAMVMPGPAIDPFGGDTILRKKLREGDDGVKFLKGSKFSYRDYRALKDKGIMNSTGSNTSGYFKMSSHGGACCGSRHLFPFPPHDPLYEYFLEQQLKHWMEQSENNGRNIEVTLTQGQCSDGKWPAALVRLGFRLTSAHGNTNSGNTVFVWNLSIRNPFHERPAWMKKLGIEDPNPNMKWNRPSTSSSFQNDPRKGMILDKEVALGKTS